MDLSAYKECLLNILKYNILGTPLSIDIDHINLKELRNAAKFHELEALLYPALKDFGVPDDNLDEIKRDYDIAIAKYLNQEYYAEAINKELNKENIKHVFLKGSVLRKLYPAPELRQSADTDIFFDAKYADNVKNILCKMGFVNTKFGSDQDVYCIQPFVCVEMHRLLLPPRSKQSGLGKAISERLIQKDDAEYMMSDEDFYLFHIIHIAKHMGEGGIGIRAFLDLWIYLRKYNDTLDWNYIEKELDDVSLSDFEKHVRCLALYWFENGEKDELTDEIEEYVIYSGWNGTSKQKTALMSEDYVKDKKVVYYFKYIFKSIDELRLAYPFLEKRPWLYPVAVFDRFYRAIFVRKNAISKFLHRYDNIKDDDIDYLKDFVKRIGL